MSRPIDKTYANLWCPFIGLTLDITVHHTYLNEKSKKRHSKSYVAVSADGASFFSMDSSVFVSFKSDTLFSKINKGQTAMFGFSYKKWYEIRRELLRFRDAQLPTFFSFNKDGTATFAIDITEDQHLVIDNYTTKGRSDITVVPYLTSSAVFDDSTDFEVSKGYPAIGLYINGEAFFYTYLDDFYSFVDYLQDVNLPAMVESIRTETLLKEIQQKSSGYNTDRTNTPVSQPKLKAPGITLKNNRTI